jgi:hypothetical protein
MRPWHSVCRVVNRVRLPVTRTFRSCDPGTGGDSRLSVCLAGEGLEPPGSAYGAGVLPLHYPALLTTLTNIHSSLLDLAEHGLHVLAIVLVNLDMTDAWPGWCYLNVLVPVQQVELP